MIFPQIQKVTADLKATLERICKTGGYQTDVAVRVASFDYEAMNDRDAELVLRLDSFEMDQEDTPLGHSDMVQTYGIAVLVRASDDSAAPMHDRMMTAAADVERAVMDDVTRGGNAILTDFLGGDLINAPDEGLYGVDLNFRVRVRYLIDEPYKLTE